MRLIFSSVDVCLMRVNVCVASLWCLYCTFIARDEWFGPALKSGRNDGAVAMWKDVLWVVVDVFPAVGTSLQAEKAETEKQIQTHVHSVNTNTSDCRQAFLHHADSLIPFLAGLDGVSASLWLSNDRQWEGELKPIHNPDHNSHGLWCEYLSWSLRTMFPTQHLICREKVFTVTFVF